MTSPDKRASSWFGALCALVFTALALFALTAQPAGAEPPARLAAVISDAKAAYDAGRYQDAVDLYREVLDAGWSSAELYYNLGCASQRAGLTGWAVAYLEEARRLDPHDASISHNLRIARAGVRDRLEGESHSWILGALTALLDGYSPGDAIAALLACMWIAAAGLVGVLLLTGSLRQIARRGLLVVAVAAALAGAALALKAYQVESAPSGVVVANEVEVLAGPRAEEKAQFALHSGSMVHLGRSAGAWREVWLSEQLRGWVPADGIAALSPPRWTP